MISLAGQKSKHLIEQIRSHETEPKTLQGFFSPEELSYLKDVSKKAYARSENTSKKLLKANNVALGHMAHVKDDLHDNLVHFFKPKLQAQMMEPFEMAFTFHRNYFPYGTHTDSGYDESEWIYKQGIVPLEVDPIGQRVFTVIFDQKCYHSISYPTKLETIESLKPEELKVIEGLDPQNSLDNDTLNNCFSGEIDKERFKGFTTALPFEWKLGNMALWDRAHLHCSSDFEPHGVKGKLGLMWISWRV